MEQQEEIERDESALLLKLKGIRKSLEPVTSKIGFAARKFHSFFVKRNMVNQILIIVFLFFLTLDWTFMIAQLFGSDKEGVIQLNSMSIIRNTLIWGSLFLSMAMGLTLTYKLLNFPNFAHAEYLVVGGYMAIFLASTKFFQEGEPLAPTLLFMGLFFGFLAGGAVAVAGDVFVFRPLRKKHASPETMMISSLGLSLVLRGILLLRFTNDNRAFSYAVHPFLKKFKKPIRISSPRFEVRLGFELSGFTNTIQFAIVIYEIFMVTSILLIVFAVYLFIRKSRMGKAMRATADNPELAASSGINVEKINLLAAFIGGGMAGVAGAFYAGLIIAFRPETGIIFLLPAFAVIVLGTIGSLPGAIIAAFIMGFGRAISEPILGGLADPLERPALTTFRTSVPFVILIIILLFFEQGIGHRLEENKIKKYQEEKEAEEDG